jgi:hypothetical protein
MFRELGDRFNEADVLAHLGDYYRDTGDASVAIQHWRRSLAILDELHHPNAAKVRTKLASIPS